MRITFHRSPSRNTRASEAAARRLRAAVVVSAGLSFGLSLLGSVPAAAQDSVTVAARDYSAGWLHRWFLGSDYRDLWSQPVRVPVLDLARYAGGLTPTRTGGFGQTISLQFVGANGKPYSFRSIDKDLSRRLRDEFLGTFVQSTVQDQTSAYNPAAALVAYVLSEAAGLTEAEPEMYVMPDDPALGEFREEFAGMLGILIEFPNGGPNGTAGFAGSSFITNSDGMLAQLMTGPRHRVEETTYLRARLFDIFVGDRDRHEGQWRWARYEDDGGFVWRVIPEDRDQPFVKQDGLALGVARTFIMRKLTRFSEKYTNLAGLTWNGWDLDRRFLSSLPEDTWDAMARDIARRVTDDVIRDAVNRLPPEYRALRGEELTRELRARRDALPDEARRYFSMLAQAVELHGTDADELVVVERHAGGELEVTITARGASSPHVRRTFNARDVDEIRLFLHGGADRAVVRGPGSGITVRILGGEGADTLADESAAGARLYDAGPETVFVRGGSTRVDTRDFRDPPSLDPFHEHPPDWGAWTRPLPVFGAIPDVGVTLGIGIIRDRYGFRKYPYSSRLTASVSFATGSLRPGAEIAYEQREILPGTHLRLGARVSGYDVVRFHGFGNETAAFRPSRFFKVEQVNLRAGPELVIQPADRVEFGLGPEFNLAVTEDEANTLIGVLGGVYGDGTFAQIGFGGRLRLDGRDRPIASTRGAAINLSGAVYPALFDVEDTYGDVRGEFTGYVTAHVTLAVRVGGQKVWGRFPFQNAAYLGGATTIRGFSERRFAGDASVYSNVELRIPVAPIKVIFPGRFGVFGLADFGRVFFGPDPDAADDLHTAFGGGIWVSFIDEQRVFSIAIADSDERTTLYLRSGFGY